MKKSPLIFLLKAALLLIAFSGLAAVAFFALCLFTWVLPIAALLLLALAIGFLLSGSYLTHLRLQSWRIARSFFEASFFFWFFVFFVCAVCHYLGLFGFQMVSSRIRFPSADVYAVAIDTKGRIYCAERLYSRLQVFDSNGDFLKGWFVRSRVQGVGLHIDENDHPVFRRNDDRLYVYDSNGLLLAVDENLSDPNGRYAGYRQSTFEDAAGNKYESAGGLFLPWRLVGIENGRQRALISEPLVLWFVSPFFPGALFLLISWLGAFLLDRKIGRCEVLQAYSSNKVTM
jgi:hypothetical protein